MPYDIRIETESGKDTHKQIKELKELKEILISLEKQKYFEIEINKVDEEPRQRRR